jgi:hypothetical protein
MQAVLLAVIQSDTSDCLQDRFQDGLLASKHDFFLSGMISCWLSFICTGQFLLSTAKGRCLLGQIHFQFLFFSSNQGGQEGRLVRHFGEHSIREPGISCPLRQEGSAVLPPIFSGQFVLVVVESATTGRV